MAATGRPFLTEEQAFKDLLHYYEENGSKINIRQAFEDDANRFDKYR